MKTPLHSYTQQKKELPQAYVAWKQEPTEQNYTELMKFLEPTLSSALYSFAGGDESLKTRAQILAAQALQSYDPSKGATLKTHVYGNLQRLQRYRAERSAVVHVPENIRLDATAVRKFETEFADKNGRDASLSEVADGIGLSLRRVAKTKYANNEVTEGQMTGEKGDLLLGGSKKDKSEIWKDYVYHDLDPVNKKVFEWTTGYLGSPILPKKEIATKLKITPAAISGRVNTIIKRLEEGIY